MKRAVLCEMRASEQERVSEAAFLHHRIEKPYCDGTHRQAHIHTSHSIDRPPGWLAARQAFRLDRLSRGRTFT